MLDSHCSRVRPAIQLPCTIVELSILIVLYANSAYGGDANESIPMSSNQQRPASRGAPLSAILAALLMAAAASAGAAEDVIKDGRPCLSGICVGDAVATLAAIEWDEATSLTGTPVKSAKVSADVVRQLTARFAPAAKEAVEAAAPYLIGLKFDGGAIDKLAKVEGFCDPMLRPMEGTFKSDSGFPTKVLLDVEPGEGGATQALRVTSISRKFPLEFTADQLKELEQQLRSRYGAVKVAVSAGDPKVPTWRFNPSTRELTLWATTTPSMKETSLLRRFPGCGKALKID